MKALSVKNGGIDCIKDSGQEELVISWAVSIEV